MATVEKYLVGTVATLITTGSAVASNALAVNTSGFNNTVGSTGDGYIMGEFEFNGTFGAAPTDNTGISVWFLGQPDGTNYEDGDATVGGTSDKTPARAPDIVFPLKNANGTSQRIVRRAMMPPGTFRPLMKNDGTGQSLNSGATLKVRPYTPEGA